MIQRQTFLKLINFQSNEDLQKQNELIYFLDIQKENNNILENHNLPFYNIATPDFYIDCKEYNKFNISKKLEYGYTKIYLYYSKNRDSFQMVKIKKLKAFFQ